MPDWFEPRTGSIAWDAPEGEQPPFSRRWSETWGNPAWVCNMRALLAGALVLAIIYLTYRFG